MPETYTKSLAACKEAARKFDDIAAAIKDEGMLCGYHAHGRFQKIGDELAWDLFFENTCKDVVMQLDLGNCIEGGGDPIATLKRFPGRSQTIHFKETGGADRRLWAKEMLIGNRSSRFAKRPVVRSGISWNTNAPSARR